MEAADFMGLALLSGLLEQLIPFAARVLLGLFVLGLGMVLARALQRLVNDAVGAGRLWPGTVAKLAVLYVAVGFALNTVGVADRIVVLAFSLPLAALVMSSAIAFGVAFGVGGKKFAGEKLEEWFGRTGSTGG